MADLAFYLARYDREIRYFDDELGRLLEGLGRRWAEAPGLVAFTADHGESLDEHRYYLAHGALPFQPTVRVPLIIRLPDRLPAGRVVQEPAGLVALVPTLLELLGVPVPAVAQEPSLVPWIEDRAGRPSRAVFGQAGIRIPAQAFVRRGRFKLVRFSHPEEIERFGELALYDLETDPGETRNAIAEHPEAATALRRELEDWLSAGGAEIAGAERDEAALDTSEQQMLRSLGYTQ